MQSLGRPLIQNHSTSRLVLARVILSELKPDWLAVKKKKKPPKKPFGPKHSVKSLNPNWHLSLTHKGDWKIICLTGLKTWLHECVQAKITDSSRPHDYDPPCVQWTPSAVTLCHPVLCTIYSIVRNLYEERENCTAQEIKAGALSPCRGVTRLR